VKKKKSYNFTICASASLCFLFITVSN